ncbi:hypothetical protein IE53DRAFT_123126 [Violaceomyces palustris]|uniref:Uncharacterized protein n=1 Tax=Violaceomyces palustris TaxID=1673888 RepID=A0ACD0NVK0_9BASI|nr:hypothetical protein IE53DRAFT_123126 [Violaceomyces palustris]
MSLPWQAGRSHRERGRSEFWGGNFSLFFYFCHHFHLFFSSQKSIEMKGLAKHLPMSNPCRKQKRWSAQCRPGAAETLGATPRAQQEIGFLVQMYGLVGAGEDAEDKAERSPILLPCRHWHEKTPFDREQHHQRTVRSRSQNFRLVALGTLPRRGFVFAGVV